MDDTEKKSDLIDKLKLMKQYGYIMKTETNWPDMSVDELEKIYTETCAIVTKKTEAARREAIVSAGKLLAPYFPHIKKIMENEF